MTGDFAPDLTDDGFFGGRLKLLQPARGHRVGTDAALLTAAALGRMGTDARVADFGAGVGAVGLSLAIAGAAHATLVEIEPAAAALARDNAGRNGLQGRVDVTLADVAEVGRVVGPAPDTLDLVAANPPFDDAGRFRASPDAARARAHAAEAGLVELWTRAAARLLKPGGVFVMIHRPEAIGEIVAACAGRFGDLRLRPVHPRADAPALRLLVAATKGRRGPLALLPGFVLHGSDGGFTPEAVEVQRGRATIAMG
ncbi:tRNA1(Val) (adenine(37)-N6)-methyltransferase [Methylopila turkensis]|uniref:Methyltransferase n=1 Tax=Methylopila turkensis TaxID=1437816 RepID=A0A9W6JLL8_9HYPH|nr:methyltransferase [Methylopila turkensis]GLK79442.1 methyltransferase [Methylopila turkensis]